MEVGTGMEGLVVMKGLLMSILLFFYFSLLVLCIFSLFFSCFLLFSALVLFSIPGAPLNFNLIE